MKGFFAWMTAASLGLCVAVDARAGDLDGDTVPDGADNCHDQPLLPNPLQLDTNGDGFGNVCDGDYTNDGIIGVPDFAILAGVFGTALDPDVFCRDVIAGGAVVWINDFIFCIYLPFGGAPGPGVGAGC